MSLLLLLLQQHAPLDRESVAETAAGVRAWADTSTVGVAVCSGQRCDRTCITS